MNRSHPTEHHLQKSSVSWRWFAVASLVWLALIIGTQESPVGAYFESRFARPIDFRVRHMLGKSVQISDRIKIYAVDDSTVGQVGSTMLTLDKWAELINLIVRNRPSAIFIDQMFTLAVDQSGKFRAALDQARANEVDVGVGAFFTPFPIKYREKLETDRVEYSLAKMLGKEVGAEFSDDVLPPLTDRRSWFGFGPANVLRPSLSYIGHLIYNDDGLVSPLVRLSQGSALGHMSIYAAKERKIVDGRFYLNGTLVPLNPEGQVVVNLPHPREIMSKTKSMLGLVNLAEEGRPSSLIQPGDVVILLPLMFTGNVDFHETPFGNLPGGYLQVAMFNSVVTGEWLKPLMGGVALSTVFTMTGGLVGMYLFATPFWLVFIFFCTSAVVLSQYLFSSYNIVIPWIFPLAGFIGNAITIFAEKTRIFERRTEGLRQALEGAVAPGELQHLLRTPEAISFEARERVVTLMFIDVVGFSRLAENMMPRIAFEQLKAMLSSLGQAVHEFGGVIDKTLGDGLLCYFGYRFDADASSPDHAEKALRCAMKIQADNVKRNIDAANSGDPVYPLRIGINTASCYLGDLGSQNRIDFTVVGNGVNFAKRLEGACEMHSVLVGATTYDLVKNGPFPITAVTKRQIRIKHHSELVEAYEYDPLYDKPDMRRVAIEGFRKSANINRNDRRWPVNDPDRITVSCDFGQAELVNFSYSGFSIRLKKLLVRGTRMAISLDSPTGKLQDLLAKEGMRLLHGEVRWGYAEGNEFVHGVFISNLSTRQSEMLVQYLCEFAFSWDQTQEKGDHQAS
jgi:class 3 adenylate cyclase